MTFKAPLVVAPPTYNIVDELKAEGDWSILQKYSGFEFDDLLPKSTARTQYEPMMYLERPGCNLCMGNQEKAAKGDTVMATSTRLFKGRVVADSDEKKRASRSSPRPRWSSSPRSSGAPRAWTSTSPRWTGSSSPASRPRWTESAARSAEEVGLEGRGVRGDRHGLLGSVDDRREPLGHLW